MAGERLLAMAGTAIVQPLSHPCAGGDGNGYPIRRKSPTAGLSLGHSGVHNVGANIPPPRGAPLGRVGAESRQLSAQKNHGCHCVMNRGGKQRMNIFAGTRVSSKSSAELEQDL